MEAAPYLIKMKTIELNQNKIVMIDDEDYDFLMQWRWFTYTPNKGKSWYVVRHPEIRPGNKIVMHREIMKAPEHLHVDHIDHNGLNNQKINLRLCTNAENSRNKSLHRKCSSTYRGVSWHKGCKRWVAQMMFSYKKIHLGCFKSEIEAAKCYDENAKKHFGEFANLNFK
jgi:hypothetical protein